MAEVLIVKRGSIDRASVKVARDAGIVVVQVERLADAQFVRAGEPLSHSDMLWAALEALASGGDYDKAPAQRERLAHNLFGIVDRYYQANRQVAAEAAEPEG